MKPYRKTLRGKPSKLYRVWLEIVSRSRGKNTKSPWLYAGKPVLFAGFDCFRCYAVTHGFSKRTPSPDRIDPTHGYAPGNIRFVSRQQNSATARGSRYYASR